jgi:peptide chain release factor 1
MFDFNNVIEKLNKLKSRYHEVEEKLSDMNVINDQKVFKELSKELSFLDPVVHEFKKYNENIKQLQDLEELIAADEDKEIVEMAKEEIKTVNENLENIKLNIKKMLIPPVPNADKNTILEIRAGTGGEEAALFVNDLFQMYLRYAEKKKWKVEILSSNETGLGGYKEIIFSISGKNVYDNLRFEYGGHRVQRIPTTESGGRIHTSAVTVAVMPEVEAKEVDVKTEDLKIDVFRAGGAGGQHVNKTESAVRITHIPSGFVVQCQDSPSQHMNKASAMKVLCSRLYDFELSKQEKERSEMRKEQVGSGDRSNKIRTYNYPQNRVTDHRINLTLYKLDIFMTGEIEEMIEALKINDVEKRIQNIN